MLRFIDPLWRTLCVAAAFFGGIGIVLALAWFSGSTRIDAEAAEPSLPAELAAGRAKRCSNCGWIESKRELAPDPADRHAPAVYEYTVRMTDGSSSTFLEALPASWRIRERLTIIQ